MADRVKTTDIRNVCIIAHVDHGKTTLADSFLARAHLLNEAKAGTALYMDSMAEEQQRGITIKSSGVSLYFEDWNANTEPKHRHVSTPTMDVDSDDTATLDQNRSSDVYIGNVPRHHVGTEEPLDELTLHQELTSLFASFGKISSMASNIPRGHARVAFENVLSCDAALRYFALHPQQLYGRHLRIERCGQGPIQLLARICTDKHTSMPEYVVLGDGRVQLRIESVDMTLISRQHESIKDAKLDVARQAIDVLQPQPPECAKSTASIVNVPDSHASAGFLVNLIDCPGHVDFNGEVTAALRLTDGAIVVVDCVEGVCVQTEIVLRQALTERVRPVLFLNKLDRAIKELQLDPEACYQRLCSTIDAVNTVIATYQPEGCDYTVSPAKGNVAFGSGLHGWAFTIPDFAQSIVARHSRSHDSKQTLSSDDVLKLSRRLWGDHFVDKVSSKWGKCSVSDIGVSLQRGFCTYILQPIYDIYEHVRTANHDALFKLTAKIPSIVVGKSEVEQGGKPLLKAIMKTWLPVAESILKMVEVHLPSPIEAQQYRAPLLYSGPSDDVYCRAMMKCDSSGPLMVYVSKMIPSANKGNKQFYAFARVFSGRIQTGQKVYVCGANYVPGAQVDVYEARVTGLVMMMAAHTRAIEEASAGQIIGIVGIDKYLSKSCTVTSDLEAHRMRVMKFNVSPVVRVAIEASTTADTIQVHDALNRLVKSDPCAQHLVDHQTNETILCGAGELHLDVCVNTLNSLAGVPIRVTEPVVQYCESVTIESPVCLSKSSNKHNRIYIRASPLSSALCKDLEDGIITMATDVNSRVTILSEAHGWSRERARRVISISQTCILVDATVGVSIGDIRDNSIASFYELCLSGPMVGEVLRGICFEIVDVKTHADSAHRRADQICPTMRRACFAALLSAQPRLMEPMFTVDISVPDYCLNAVCKSLKKRRADILEDIVFEGTPLHSIRAYLPVATSFGFSTELRSETSGRAFPQCSFSHWQLIDEDPTLESSRIFGIVRDTRARKKMAGSSVSLIFTYLDTL